MAITRQHITVAEYEQMGTDGTYHEDDRVELIAGEIITMSPIGTRHMQCVNRLTQLVSRVLPDGLIASVQNPIRLSADTEPQPDLTVLYDRHYTTTPTASDTLLLIEVADTTLAYDRGRKIPLYAAAGIPEVWIVNLAAQAIEQYTDPAGNRYRRIVTIQSDTTIASATLPALALSVATILS